MTDSISSYRILAGCAADAGGVRNGVVLTIEDGVISAQDPLTDETHPAPGDQDCRDLLVVPGFIDIHVHGGAGDYVMSGEVDGLRRIARHLARHGVTGFLSTTVTGPWDLQAQAVSIAAEVMTSSANGADGAAVLGVHLEGPYYNPARKGAQPGEYILPPDVDNLVDGVGDNLSIIKLVTLAPEMPGALELIRFLTRSGIVSSIGHTDATYDQVSAGIEAGARHVTHCFNAMRQMEGREPGVVGAAMSRPELKAELIWDNIHVHPASCRALVNAKTANKTILISDGIPGAGMPERYQFSLGDYPVVVHNGAARLADGTLAGSLLTLDTAFRNAGEFSFAERAAMTAYNAADSLGLAHRKGMLKPGFDADFVILDSDGIVQRTIVAGRTVYSRPGT